MTARAFIRRWARRTISTTAYLVASAGVWGSLPFLLPIALIVGGMRGSRFSEARLLGFIAIYLLCALAGLAGGLAVWIGSGVWAGRARDRFEDWNRTLQRLWACSVFDLAARVYGVRLEVEGEGEVGCGPLLVFMRHVSLADTVLPVVILVSRLGYRLRYVLKRELLWEPNLDIVGHRIPNVFVDRGSGESEKEIATVRALARGLQEREAVVIYPEGTRFSPERLASALRNLTTQGDPARLARVTELTHVLPPRLGGPLGLVDERPDLDVLFVEHVGFEGAARLTDLWRGALIGRTVRVRMRRVPAAEIPKAAADRVEWLDREWVEVDRWVRKGSDPYT